MGVRLGGERRLPDRRLRRRRLPRGSAELKSGEFGNGGRDAPVFEHAPERVAIARDARTLSGYMVCMTPATAPEFADEDPLSARGSPTRGRRHLGESVLWHDSVDFTGTLAAGSRRCWASPGCCAPAPINPRFAYLPINPANAARSRSRRALGRQHLPELDLEFGSRRIECYRIDYGPGGLLAAQRAVVYAELGLPPPQTAQAAPPAAPTSRRCARRCATSASRTSSRAARWPAGRPRRAGRVGRGWRSATPPSARSATPRTRSCSSEC